MKPLYPLLFLTWLLFNCGGQIPVENIDMPPTFKEADRAYAGVYKSLDGNWRGTFHIFEDTARQSKNQDLLTPKDSNALAAITSLKWIQSIKVEQKYNSESPYFQRVAIKDFYPGSGETVSSIGVNKIQDGAMWCVVEKPDERIVHRGNTDGPQTIIWQREEAQPQKVEYFRETVLPNTYEIVGWGYYEGDDLDLMPKYWFYSKYLKQ